MPQSLTSAPQNVRKPTPRPTVLIVENDETTRDAMRRYLLLHGYEVETARGGVECLEKLRRGTTQVVVLDSGIAWGGGDGVLAVMREEPRLARIPVVLTTPALRLDKVAFARVPVLRILEKPFVLESLLESIRILARGRGRTAQNRRGTGRTSQNWRGREGHS